jgi:GNAT superfamily N-acetyltransferase
LDVIIAAVAEAPDIAARDRLFVLLGEDNAKKTGRVEGADFAVLLRSRDTDEIVGGLWAVDDLGWAFINYLYVPDQLRGQGLGAQMMHAAETMARQRGMIGAWVNTYDFQARGFYENLGFSLFGALEGGPHAAGQSFLRKLF